MTTKALDACQRAFGILRGCTFMQLSPGEWSSFDGEIIFNQPEEGPTWEGEPGTHPLLPFLRAAIKELEEESR